MMKRSLLTFCAFSLLAAPACVVKVNGGSTDPGAKPNTGESAAKTMPDAADTPDTSDVEEMVPAGDAAGEAPTNTEAQPGRTAEGAEGEADVADRPK